MMHLSAGRTAYSRSAVKRSRFLAACLVVLNCCLGNIPSQFVSNLLRLLLREINLIQSRETIMAGDIEKMIAVGLVWGATNAIMRRGALLWDQKLKSSAPEPTNSSHIHRRLLATFKNWLNLLLVWQYSIPFLVNLSASATFFAILSDSPISLAVPVTNATTFAATAVVAMLLGEETRVGFALLGTFLIVLGVWICIM